MMARPLVACALALAGAACHPTLDDPTYPTPHPQPGQVTGRATVEDAELERTALQNMRMWLGEFRDRQERYRAYRSGSGRYSDDVTIDGDLAPLPRPYLTKYSVHPSGRGYWVQVRHGGSRQVCSLEEGEGAEPQAARKIDCRKY